MCMTCGCGEVDKRHHPTDITREDLQRAADGAGITLRQAAKNLGHSTDEVSRAQGRSPLPTSLPWSVGRRA